MILEIFAQHAQSREGQLQVELAMLEVRDCCNRNMTSVLFHGFVSYFKVFCNGFLRSL